MTENCNKQDVIFVARDSDPQIKVFEDDIRADLAKIGVTVKASFVNSQDYIKAELDGTYNMLFTRTWGAPYDPHSYLNSWSVPSHVEYSAIEGLNGDVTTESILGKIEAVQEKLNDREIQDGYTEILGDVHKEAFFLPLFGVRTPYVISRRLAGFSPSPQTYSYPIADVRVREGPKTVTVAAGSGGGLFTGAGPIHPHHYSPNELFIQDWVYEGLLSYGQNGEIGPRLAESWEGPVPFNNGQRVVFNLRKGVKFHDGADFNCSVAKLNFDHVLSDTVRQRHAWLAVAEHLEKWYCDDSGRFVLETSKPFYPLMQELTYIRPLTFASPNSFHMGLDSDADDHNSCAPGGFGDKWSYLEENITCRGLSKPIGTGPFKFVSRVANSDGGDDSVTFENHNQYWGPTVEIERVMVKRYESTESVKADLLSGNLDMALGVGPLTPAELQELRFNHSDVVDVRYSEITQHSALIMNTKRAPTNNATFRQAIIHAVDKGRFIEQEFFGVEQPVSQLLPQTAPYCDVDLNPKWAFDIDKATLLNCPKPSQPGDNSLSTGAIAGISVGGAFLVALVAFIIYMIRRERKGKPIFDLRQEDNAGFA